MYTDKEKDILSFVQKETKKLKDDPRFTYYLVHMIIN